MPPKAAMIVHARAAATTIRPISEDALTRAIATCGLDPHNVACGLVCLKLVEIVNGEVILGPLARELIAQWAIENT